MKKIVFSLLLISSIMQAMELPDHNTQDKNYRGLPASLINKTKNPSCMLKENYINIMACLGLAAADIFYFKSGDLYFWAGTEMVLDYLNCKVIQSQQETLKQKTVDKLEKQQSFLLKATLAKILVILPAATFAIYNKVPKEQHIYRWAISAWVGTHHLANIMHVFGEQTKINGLVQKLKKR